MVLTSDEYLVIDHQGQQGAKLVRARSRKQLVPPHRHQAYHQSKQSCWRRSTLRMAKAITSERAQHSIISINCAHKHFALLTCPKGGKYLLPIFSHTEAMRPTFYMYSYETRCGGKPPDRTTCTVARIGWKHVTGGGCGKCPPLSPYLKSCLGRWPNGKPLGCPNTSIHP